MRHLKHEFDRLSFKEVTVISIAILSQISAIVAIFCGLFITPAGQIHNSVLFYYGIACSFTAALLGISYYAYTSIENVKASVSSIIRPKCSQHSITSPTERLETDSPDNTDSL